MLCMIIYIADIDAVNMEFLVCWNLDRKIFEVSSCPSHCFGTIPDSAWFCSMPTQRKCGQLNDTKDTIKDTTVCRFKSPANPALRSYKI